ncbi:hypothetical protein F5X68DRAFT_247066 [Plectosphaerella plurivora]|uniref:Uncharacterized protein n=1 Tax=Plectosphaerella plurivora TaxID=936078 RepID=A0A9P9A521_9PEZI|nr:hypothetical protein F5X68DRAFT_247066 [Plectosphaerella plurivora]
MSSNAPYIPPLPSIAEQNPTSPPRMSGRGNRQELIVKSQHMDVCILTWFLSRTNTDSHELPSFDDRTAPRQPEPGSRTQRRSEQLYFFLQAFATVLERNHESIVADTSDFAGYKTYVATSFSSAPPATLDHIVIDKDEIQQLGHVLKLPAYLYTPKSGKARKKPTVWGHDPDDSRVRLVKAKSTNIPVPLNGHLIKYPNGFAYWLMKHTVGKVNNKVFITDVSIAEHMGNITKAIRETHRRVGDSRSINAAHIKLGMYVYLSCAAGLHENITRGFEEYSFGRILTASIRGVYNFDLDAHDYDICIMSYGETIHMPPHRRKLNPWSAASSSLVNRDNFYNAGGRILFHTLLSVIIRNIQQSTGKLVSIKRKVMEAKLANVTDLEKLKDLADDLDHLLGQVFHGCRLLNVLTVHFSHILESHAIWLAKIFSSSPDAGGLGSFPQARRPPGLVDPLAGLSRTLADPGLAASLRTWMRLLCRQERGMVKLRLPTTFDENMKRIENGNSVHVTHATTWHVSVTAAANRTAMPPLYTTIKGLGFTPEQAREVLFRLVNKGDITLTEAYDRDSAAGRRTALEITAGQLANLASRSADNRHAPFMPSAGITRRFYLRPSVALGSNMPHSRDALHMAEADLPPWTPRETARELIKEASSDAKERIREILTDLAMEGSKSLSSKST